MSKRSLSEDAAPSPAPALELYSYWRSSSSWRVRIVLSLKGLPYTYHAVNLLKAEQKGEDYARSLNPMRSVPTLVIDGKPLAQSGAIIQYLEELQPEPALLPKDAFLRAKVCGEGIALLRGSCVCAAPGAPCGNTLALPPPPPTGPTDLRHRRLRHPTPAEPEDPGAHL